MSGRVRAFGLPAALLGAAGVFAATVSRHYPLREWLFWRYAGYWLWAALFAAACLSAGHLALRALLRERLRLDVHLVLSFPLGVLAFYLGMVAGGHLGLYGPVFAIAWPTLLVAAGGLPLARHARPRLARLLRRPPPPRAHLLASLPLLAFGAAGIGMVYFLTLTPDNLAYDARWYHLAIAEHYAAEGGVRRFAEGWYQGALPHLASHLYCWAFQLPRTGLFDRIEISAHLEVALFLGTLASIPVLVRAILPGTRARAAWAAVFLFPGLLLYDSSLSGAADHVAALWAPALYLALLRAWRTPAPRPCILLGLLAAGAISTKYQAASLLVFPAAALVVRGVVWSGPTRLLGPALAAAAGVAFTAPHWLKNWLWYGDPLYPFLHRTFAGRPWTEDSAHLVEAVFEAQMWTPAGSIGQRLVETARALVTFSFVPHDWTTFHGDVPVFGSLFTLSLVALPFLRGTRRLWPLVLAVHTGVFFWFWSSHQDRYLQALVPWMAAATAATCALVWRAGGAARAALAVLVGLQIVWGGDVYFFPTHAMTGSPISRAVELLASGHRHDYRDRFHHLGAYYDVGQTLPAGARVLIHESHVHLGIDAPAVSDWSGWQGAISYGRLGSPAGVDRKLRELGVTHLVWTPGTSREWDSLAGDLLFFDYATRRTRERRDVAGLAVAAMPAQPPASPFADRVLFAGCPGTYQPGLYRLAQLTIAQIAPGRAAYPAPLEPLSAARPEDQWKQADYAVVDAHCHQAPPGFEVLARRGSLDLLARR